MAPRKTSFTNFLKQFRNRDALPLLVIFAPILFLLVADPGSFAVGWFFLERQIGRVGFIFVILLLGWDFHDSRSKLHLTSTKWRYALAGVVLAGVLAFYWIEVFYIDSVRIYVTSKLGVSQLSTLSFPLAIEFFVFAIYCVAEAAILYSPRKILQTATPVIYAVGSGVLALADAYFPGDTLGFLQAWVPSVWDVVVFLLRLAGYHTLTGILPTTLPEMVLNGNNLCVWGFKGFACFIINWQCSGFVSMIIYNLVAAALILKLDAPRKRKLIYFAIGVLGTYFVNLIRITLIVLYVSYITMDLQIFHESIGEILFIGWIIIYLLLVIRFENRA